MKKNILFIDDDESFLTIVRRACSKIATIAEVMTARDGQEGKDLLVQHLQNHSHLPSLIFVDINMPRMDGFAFLRAFSILRDQYQELKNVRPIAMLTSSDEETDKEKAITLGADEYIVKPASLLILREMLSDFVQ